MFQLQIATSISSVFPQMGWNFSRMECFSCKVQQVSRIFLPTLTSEVFFLKLIFRPEIDAAH